MKKFAFVIAYVITISAILLILSPTSKSDDPYITYRYAANLSAGKGFVYNPGERILSTTTPLFTLLLALLSPLWKDIPSLASWLSAFSLAIGSIYLWKISQEWNSQTAGIAALTLFPTFPLIVSTSGFETPLYLLFCLGAFYGYTKSKFNTAAILAGLATLTRPDGLLVILALIAHDYLAGSRKTILKLLAVYFVITAPWFIFAWIYFGSPIPLTLFAKQSQGTMVVSQKFAPGMFTVFQWYSTQWWFWGTIILAVLGCITTFRENKAWWLLFSWEILYFLSYSLLGVSRYFWYYAPLIPGLIACTGLGLSFISKVTPQAPNPNLKISNFVSSILLAAILAGQLFFLFRMRSQQDSRYRIYRAASNWLVQNTSKDSSVGVLETGIIGYFSERQMVDFAGLLKPEVANFLNTRTTYPEAALFVYQEFNPDYIILHSNGFENVGKQITKDDCQLVFSLLGETYHYASDLLIYQCQGS